MLQPRQRQNRTNGDGLSQRRVLRGDPFDRVGKPLTTSLLDWYRDGQDVQARLPLLSTWLGHVDPKSTYWYLQAVPELLALAAGRLEQAGRQAAP